MAIATVAAALATNLASDTIHISARWWPWLIWPLTIALSTWLVVAEVKASRDRTSGEHLARIAPKQQVVNPQSPGPVQPVFPFPDDWLTAGEPRRRPIPSDLPSLKRVKVVSGIMAFVAFPFGLIATIMGMRVLWLARAKNLSAAGRLAGTWRKYIRAVLWLYGSYIAILLIWWVIAYSTGNLR